MIFLDKHVPYSNYEYQFLNLFQDYLATCLILSCMLIKRWTLYSTWCTNMIEHASPIRLAVNATFDSNKVMTLTHEHVSS